VALLFIFNNNFLFIGVGWVKIFTFAHKSKANSVLLCSTPSPYQHDRHPEPTPALAIVSRGLLHGAVLADR
jgi:hypothetical protein